MSTRMTELNNEIIAVDDPVDHEDQVPRRYNGKRSTLPGFIALILLIIGAAVGITFAAINERDNVQFNNPTGNEVNTDTTGGSTIEDGSTPPGKAPPPVAVTNPTEFEDKKCTQPNYITRNNRIVAEYSSGDETYAIKGVSWFGMEQADGVPLGLWDNAKTGTNIYQIGAFLKRNNFNSVRIPLCVEHLSRNIIPTDNLINTNTNKALNIKRYRSLLMTIVQGLARHGISVLLDFHTLTPKEAGNLWFNENVRDVEYKRAIASVAQDMCNGQHWNVLGIELKNAPNQGTWGDDTETDWKVASESYGAYMLEQCSNWLVFIDGVQAKRTITLSGEEETFRDWEGGGLQDVQSALPDLPADKVVWSPHYYSPSKVPQRFLYGGGTPSGAVLEGYTELNTEALTARVQATMADMFGYLAAGSSKPAIVLAEFGGLYGSMDDHPEKTSDRTLKAIIAQISGSSSYAGGYAWALNPGTYWEYNPADTVDVFESGLLDLTWRGVNDDMLDALKGMDDMTNLQSFECVKK